MQIVGLLKEYIFYSRNTNFKNLQTKIQVTIIHNFLL